MNIQTNRLCAFILLVMLTIWASPLAAQDKTKKEISEPPASPGIKVNVLSGAKRVLTALAIPDAKGGNALGKRAIEVLKKDLEVAGFFSIVPSKSIFFDATKEGMTKDKINFQNWGNVNAKGLIQTSIAKDGTLDMRLFVVSKKARAALKWKPRKVTSKTLDKAIHEFANAVVLYYTGKTGIFGTPIAFVMRNKSKLKQVYVTDMAGTSIRAITSNSSINMLPRYSKGRIFYTSYKDRNPDLWVYSGGRHTKLSSQRGQNSGAVQCGSKLALTMSMGGTNTDIYLIDAKTGKKVSRLTNHWSIDTSPSWSADCSKIAFVSGRSGSPHIYIMNADGSGQRRLTYKGSYNTNPTWSPKGNVIAFQARDSKGAFDIFTVNLSGGLERLTQNQGNNESPSFSPDGRYVVFTTDRTKRRSKELWVMTADGQYQRRILKGGGRYSPSWAR